MKVDYSKLRGRIIEKYGTITNFAKLLGVSQSTLNTKLVKGTSFSPSQLRKTCSLLGISLEEIGSYFFAEEIVKSQN